MEILTKTLRTLADPTRLRIVALLARSGELCVCDIERILGFTQTKVSRHLAYLRRAGLVRVRRRQLWKHYSLAPLRNATVSQLFDVALGLIRESPEIVRDRRILEQKLRTGSCAACRPDMPSEAHPPRPSL